MRTEKRKEHEHASDVMDRAGSGVENAISAISSGGRSRSVGVVVVAIPL